MNKLENPIVVIINDELKLEVQTGRTARTGVIAYVKVLNGKLIHSDEVKLGTDKDRGRFAARVLAKASGVDPAAIEEALLQLAVLVEKQFSTAQSTGGNQSQYVSNDEGTFTVIGTATTTLANFGAKIVREVIEDDGLTEARYLDIECLQNGETLEVTVPSEQFQSMNWVIPKLGPQAIVESGYATRDRTREAIQRVSTDVVTQRVFIHTGWRKLDDGWVYLHAAGGIGTQGEDKNVSVDLMRSDIGSYELPSPPDGEKLNQAIQASLATLDLGPRNITFPLLAATYRAPLAEMNPADQSVFVEGKTGCQKSSLTAVFQAFYGRKFSFKHLPGSWVSTDNSLELQSFAAKDAVFVVDDFKPTGTKWDINALHKKADRLLRGQANQQGRGRMTQEGAARPSYHPRGIIVSSGEDVPKGQSLNARMVILSLKKGNVDLGRLTEAQENARQGDLAQSMAGYLQWLASQLDELRESLPKRQEELRTQARERLTEVHDRIPENVASLALGWEMFLRFAEEKGALTAEDAESLWDEGWGTLVKVGQGQEPEQESQDETERFIELISSALSTRRAYLDTPTGTSDPSLADYSGRRFIGWQVEGGVYLDPNAAYSMAQKLAQEEDNPLTTRRETIQKRLKDAGLLAGYDKDRATVHPDIGGKQRRVLFLKPGVLGEKTGPSGPTGPESASG